jgi:hypothetical protein
VEKFIARDTVEQMMEELSLEREPDDALFHTDTAGLGSSRGGSGVTT